MSQIQNPTGRFTFLLKSLFLSLLLTAVLLLLLALALYRFSLSGKTVSLCITGIYILVTFLAGFFTGKQKGTRKFLWGLAMGFLYFFILVLFSLLTGQKAVFSTGFFTALILCAGSGMLGGMLG
jgi:putative membrane protein (TIGR04086 family)